MFNLFKQDIKVGDNVKLILTTGREPEGIVREIGENYVLLEADDKSQTRYFDKLIGGWMAISKKVTEEIIPKGIRLMKICRSFDIGIVQLVEFFAKEGIYVENNPNAIISYSVFNEIKPKLENLFSELVSPEIDAFINEAINSEDKSNPLSDSQLWKLFSQTTGAKVKRKKIVSSRKRLGIDEAESRKVISDSEVIDIEDNISKTYHSFEELKEIAETEQLHTFISPNAEVDRYFVNYANGSARNEEIQEIRFKNDVVFDEELFDELQHFRKGTTIPIICSYLVSGNKAYAYLVVKPNTVEKLIEKTLGLIENNQIDGASRIISYLKRCQIDLPIMIELNKKVGNKTILTQTKNDTSEITIRQDDILNKDPNVVYEYARKLRLKKQFDESEKLFLMLINKNFQIDSVVKTLADQYREQGRIIEAITLVESNLEKFEKTIQAGNFLYDLYVNSGELEKAKNTLLTIVDLPFDEKNSIEVKRMGKAYARLGALLLKTEQIEEAKKYFKEASRLYPENRQLKNALQILSSAGKDSNKNVAKQEKNITKILFGISPFLTDALETCSYDGLPLAVKESRKFDEKTLAELKSEIQKNAGYGYNLPRSRASLYLTQAKLMQDLEMSDDDEFYRSLARYCFAMGRVALVQRSPMDYCLEYFLNGFRLETDREIVNRQAIQFIQAINNYRTGVDIKESITINEAITTLISYLDSFEMFWIYLAELHIESPIASDVILFNVLLNPEGTNFFIHYLSSHKLTVDEKNKDIKYFQSLWIKYVENRKEDKEKALSVLKNILRIKNENELVNYYFENYNMLKGLLINQTETSRLSTIYRLCENCLSYNNNQHFDDREIFFNTIENYYNNLYNEIKESPTNLGISYLLPILSHFYNTYKVLHQGFIIASKPLLSLNLEGDCIIDHEGDCEIQISVSNKQNCSRVSDLKIGIIELKEGVTSLIREEYSNRSLKGGGDAFIGKLKIKISDNIKTEGATEIKVRCEYKEVVTSLSTSIEQVLSISFYEDTVFSGIDNPYAEHVRSNIVENPKMFKGRSELIGRVCETILNAKAKGYVIYGQKRSGKSSVLWHLENKLNESGKVFAVYYSSGLSIAQDGNIEANLYYRILTTIERKIAKLGNDGIQVPEIGSTKLKELLVSPPLVFYDRLNEIKNAFGKMQSWRDKKLCLIIDEFTYIYYQIKKKSIPTTFMQNWKAFVEDGGFSLILSGQDTMKQFMNEFPNEFGMFKPERLTYLDPDSAKELIEDPVWDENKKRSRYSKEGVEKIINLTACNPFYIQIVCNELVRFMNARKKPVLTTRDIDDVIEYLTTGYSSLTEIDFENLLSAGDKQLDLIKPDQSKGILLHIAKQTKNLQYCRRDDIAVFGNVIDDLIISDLLERAVISEEKGHQGKYKIEVQLFKHWLINCN